jgi:beta-exotoxin I transport system permease protein
LSTSCRGPRISRRSSSTSTRRPTVALELFRRGLGDHRRALVGWGLGVIGYAALVASIFPSIKGAADFKKLVQQYPDALKSLFGLGEGGDITSGAGYMDAELFSLILPLLVLVLAIGSGARTFAGEEDRGLLELGLSYPVRRRDAVLAKGAAVAAEILVVCVCGLAALVVLNEAVGLDLSFRRIAAALGGVAALGLFFGWLALAIGAAIPSRMLAVGVPAALAAAAYLVGGLHQLAGWLDPLRFLSPFWLVGSTPLQKGIDSWGTLAVVAAASGVLLLGSALVGRRDLETP